MKTNAIIRIIIWSLVIVVLLGILTAGLGFQGLTRRWDWDDDDVPAATHVPERIEPTEAHVYLERTFYAAESINIHEKPSEQAEIRSIIEPGDTVHLGREEKINGQSWGYVTDPGSGWILLDDYMEETTPTETEVSPILDYTVTATTNVRAEPDPMAEIVGAVEAKQIVTLTQQKEINGHHWGYIEAPVQGWLLLVDYEPEATVPTITEPSSAEPPASPNTNGADARGYGCNASDVSEISIEWAAGNIHIIPVEGNRISVTETGDFEKHPMTIKNKNGKLSIEYCEEKAALAIGLNYKFSKDLTIEVPKDFLLQELDIDAASATVLVQDLTIREVEFDGASGTCEFVNCTVDKLDVDTASGDIRFGGSLSELDCDAASASFIAELTNVPYRMEMDSMSGNLDVTLPEDAGFTVTMDGMRKDFTTDFAATCNGSHHQGHGHSGCDQKTHVHGDGACRIKMDAMSGEVIIRKAK